MKSTRILSALLLALLGASSLIECRRGGHSSGRGHRHYGHRHHRGRGWGGYGWGPSFYGGFGYYDPYVYDYGFGYGYGCGFGGCGYGCDSYAYEPVGCGFGLNFYLS